MPGAATITVDNKAAQIALIYLGCFFIGWNETVCLANATIILHDQQEIGVAGGVAGSMRGAISAVSISVYSTVLNNRLAETVPNQVAPAVTAAGLPASSVIDFLGAIGVGTPEAFAAVEGATTTIVAVGTAAYQQAAVDAFRTVYFTVIAFAGIGIILCFFASNTENLMLDSVAATLHNETPGNQVKGMDEEKGIK